MSSSSGEEGTLTSPTEQQGDALIAKTTDAKLMVATSSGDVQQLKDMVKKQESELMVVVMPKQQAATAEKHHQGGNMDPHLLALASSASYQKLQSLLNDEAAGQTSGHCGSTDGRLTARRASSYGGEDTEANESILAEAKHLLPQENDKWRRWRSGCWSRGERQATYGYGDGDNFLNSAHIIYDGKAKHLLFAQNNKGDTPLHCAARAGKSKMVTCLVELAQSEDKMKEFLRKENKHKETALHEAVRVGNKDDIVDLLMGKDSELASFPQDSGASPMYLAIVLRRDEIVEKLYDKCSDDGNLSFSGRNGQNALHAAVLRYRDLTKLLEWNKAHLCPQNKDLTTQKDENGSTRLHLAAERISIICRQVLEANPDALYQPDHVGFFPIHVAASVGASPNIAMFVRKCPGSAGLRDAKGRTFLHVTVEKKKKNIIQDACRNLSLAWIMNMVDNDGNTTLHLAVEAGSLRMFCPLLGNSQVNLNLPNNRRETPSDIAEYKFPKGGLNYTWNSEVQIRIALRIAGAVKGARRQDHLLVEHSRTVRAKHDESREMEALKDSTQTLCIGSVLITTVTFGATFAVPGGYIADDHNHGGSPILTRRYAFDAFIVADTLAFVFSAMATIGLMYSGSPLLNPRRRQIQLGTAVYLLSISITCLAAPFALAAYVVLAPVAYKTAVATCVLTTLVVLYRKLDFIWTRSHRYVRGRG